MMIKYQPAGSSHRQLIVDRLVWRLADRVAEEQVSKVTGEQQETENSGE